MKHRQTKDHTCGLYIRVSTQRQAAVQEGSLDTQEARLRSYVDYKSCGSVDSWQVVEVYREEGHSGKDLKRPEFERLMQDVQSGRVNTVIVWKIDRLTRSLNDFSALWQALQDRGVELVSLNENFDTSTAIGRAMLSIVLVFAQLEREQTGERTSTTMQHRAEQGLWNGGRVIGYDLDPDRKGVLLVNPEQAALVRLAYDLCIERGSAGQVQRLLNERGHRLPVYESRRGKRHGGALFDKQTVIRILTNPVYVGQLRWARKLYPGRHQPIVSQERFDQVQKLLAGNRVTRTNARLPTQHTYLLQGVLRCGRCSSMMTPKSGTNGSGKPYHYYQCTKSAHKGRGGCDARYVPAQAIEDVVVERVKELATSQHEVSRIVDAATKEQREVIGRLNQEQKAVSEQLSAVKARIRSLVDTIEQAGASAFRSVSERLTALEQEQEQLEGRLESIRFEMAQAEEQTLSAQVMAEAFRSLRDILDGADPQALKELIPRIVEVVEWQEEPGDSSRGHCKIAYFEQPELFLVGTGRSEERAGVNHLFAQCVKWHPGQDSNL